MKKLILLVLTLLTINPLIYSFPKKVLVEVMTSTTCPPCASANPYLDNWINNYSMKDRVTVIKYHTWWPSPGTDPYYWNNVNDNRTRTLYYQPSSAYVPRASINGSDGGSNYNSWPTYVQNQIQSTTPINVEIQYTSIKTDDTPNEIIVKVTADNTTLPTGTYKLHFALVESNLYYTGPNGDPVHHEVLRKMYPDASGETFTIQNNQTLNFTRTVTWDAAWNLANSHFVAFVQINETKVVLQSQMIKANLTFLNKNISVTAGWNIVSIPVMGMNMTVNNIFADCISQAYEYDNNYLPVDTFQTKKAYWVKFASPKNYQVTGTKVSTLTIPVKQGWNMIGVLDKNVPVNLITTNPSGIIASSFFESNEGYFVSDTLKVGKGYWIKVNQNGNLILVE